MRISAGETTDILTLVRDCPWTLPQKPQAQTNTAAARQWAGLGIQDCVLRAAVSTIQCPLTLAHQTLTSMFALLRNPNSTFSRWVGVLLVAFIFYGTTIEAAHRHGKTLPSAPSATSLRNAEHANNPVSSKSGCSDCLICQLHQNFTATLISVRPHEDAPSRQALARTSDPISIRSIANTPQSGRAPPQAN